MLRKIILLVLLLGATFLSTTPLVYADSARSLRIKAAIVYYIAKFVRWPSELSSPHTTNEDVRVCYLKETPFIEEVKLILKDKTVRKRSFQLTKLSDSQDSLESAIHHSCEILILSKQEISSYQTTLRNLQDKPILSICTTTHPKWGECTIQIFEEKNRGKIALDRQWAEKSNLVISSELLSLSIVSPSPEK